jgi:hypothetical protein
MVKKYHAGSGRPLGTLHRGAAKPEATTVGFHAGSGAPKTLHAAPRPGVAVNSANFAGQKLKRK